MTTVVRTIPQFLKGVPPSPSSLRGAVGNVAIQGQPSPPPQPVHWVQPLRLALLVAASLWSLRLGWGVLRAWGLPRARAAGALLPVAVALAWVGSAWGWLFWWW